MPPLYTCPGCRTPYHEVCLHELGGCSTLGCSLQGRGPAGRVWKGQRARRPPRMAPGDRLRGEEEAFERRIKVGALSVLGAVALAFIVMAELSFEDAVGVLGLYGMFAFSVMVGRFHED